MDESVFHEHERLKYQQVQEETWGHLAPQRDRSYPGSMLFAQSQYGDFVILRAEFDGLDDSPWLFDAMMSFVEKWAKEPGVVYGFDGHLKNYEFIGGVEELPI